ncbi:hypothetical protein [Streptomyces enissocaesilis]|uniref:Uncharacterized protein n=1 Tax=Streptomyces enissocaesilis TaxID=332589 RepID=A0ABP6JCZ9_9ACTN
MITEGERAALLKLHEWDELIFGGFYCTHCTPDDADDPDQNVYWPCPPLREAGVTNEEAVEIITVERAEIAARHRDEYRSKLEAAQQEGRRQADEWNRLHPVGTAVVAYPGIRPEGKHAGWACTRLETTTRTPAWTLGHGEPVVSVVGYAGGICLTHVDVVTEAAS